MATVLWMGCRSARDELQEKHHKAQRQQRMGGGCKPPKSHVAIGGEVERCAAAERCEQGEWGPAGFQTEKEG